jgi:DNA polymerase-3 subunit alpha
MQMIPDFTARRHGRVKPSYDHPVMEKHLTETYGIMVYQEQVLKIAADMAGFSMSEADDLRKAMGKKKPELMAEQRAKFLAGAKVRGVKERVAERVFELMEKFAGYGFNKAHASAYGIVAYQTAYFKANYPVEFMAALLTSEMANTDKVVVHIDECRAMGIEVLPPDVNVSGFRFGVTGGTIRFGLGAIKNVGEKAIQSVVGARDAGGPFASLADFCGRVDTQLVNRRVVESLIKAGAMDSLGHPRAHLMAGLDAAFEQGQRQQRERDQGQASIFDLLAAAGADSRRPEPNAAEPPTPEWDLDQLLLSEKEVLGFYLSGHPLKHVGDRAQRLGAIGTADLASHPDGSRVVVCGLAGRIQEVNTKKGDRMAFVTLEDMHGSVELTVFPDALRQCAAHLRSGVPLLVRGKVEGSGSPRKLLAEDIRPLPAEAEAGIAAAVCRIRVPPPLAAPEGLRALRQICRGHAGSVPVDLHLEVDGHEVVVRSRQVTVRPSAGLVAEVEALLGAASVAFVE